MTLREWRIKNGYTQSFCAQQCGLTMLTWWFWENRQRSASVESRKKVKDYFGIDLSEFGIPIDRRIVEGVSSEN